MLAIFRKRINFTHSTFICFLNKRVLRYDLLYNIVEGLLVVLNFWAIPTVLDCMLVEVRVSFVTDEEWKFETGLVPSLNNKHTTTLKTYSTSSTFIYGRVMQPSQPPPPALGRWAGHTDVLPRPFLDFWPFFFSDGLWRWWWWRSVEA